MRSSDLASGFVLTMFTGAALAGDGRLELNQAAVDAAGGFPFHITAPGNYILTGDLVVPTDTDGFVLSTSRVVFDLNGFGIFGPASCGGVSCDTGTGMAIRGSSPIAHAHDTTVRNGFVTGFADNCLRLGKGAYVSQLRVTDCGRNGISVSHDSLVTQNRVSRTGEHGILLAGSNAAYTQNVVSEADLAGGNRAAVAGGKSVVGNLCDDESCSAVRERRYYLTQSTHKGDEALSACAAGYRFASLREIADTSNLRYAKDLGASRSDAGSGPPVDLFGWVRTGDQSLSYADVPGGNCSTWSVADSNVGGTVASLRGLLFGNSISAGGPHWDVSFWACNQATQAWCIEE